MTVAVLDRPALVPVTVTVYVPAEPVHDRVEVWAAPRVTLAGVRVHVRPVAGETVAVRLTVPVKALTGLTVIVDVPAVPALTVTLVGLAVTVKSRMLTVTVAVRDSDPLVPVTVTVYVPAEPVHDRAEV